MCFLLFFIFDVARVATDLAGVDLLLDVKFFLLFPGELRGWFDYKQPFG